MAHRSGVTSMTGFGRGEARSAEAVITVEIKSVNSRYFDFVCKTPKGYQELESEIKNEVASWIDRGRVEILVQRQAVEGAAAFFSEQLFQRYYEVYEKLLGRKALNEPQLRAHVVSEILAKREVLGMPEEALPLQREAKLLRQALERALHAHDQMRRFEGAKLLSDISARVAALKKIVATMRTRAKKNSEKLRQRLIERIKKIAPEVVADEVRLASEVVYLVDRSDVTEEFVRLESHFAQLQRDLGASSQGRKLEFLLQEIGREVNTIGSKGQDADLQHGVVRAKVEIEKIREQLQNVA